MNYSIHDNIFDTTKYMQHHIGATNHKWLPKMYNNIYVTGNDDRANFGLFGDYSKDASIRVYKKIEYNADFERELSEIACEEGSTVVLEK